jgi:hypothetical protein
MDFYIMHENVDLTFEMNLYQAKKRQCHTLNGFLYHADKRQCQILNRHLHHASWKHENTAYNTQYIGTQMS